MTEWWTYRPSDFLMFSPRAYARLFELANAALWPWQFVLVGAVALPLVCWRLPQAALGFVAAAWWTTRSAFIARYAEINWAAEWLGWAFVAQGCALVGLQVTRWSQPSASAVRRRAGAVLAGWGLAGQPLLGIASGRHWMQAEWFGAAPDPTVIATLGLLLWLDAPWWLWPVPLALAAVSAATLATMGSALAAVPLLALLLVLGAARRRR